MSKIVSNAVRNLLDATKEEKRRFIDSFDTILSDCDGAFDRQLICECNLISVLYSIRS